MFRVIFVSPGYVTCLPTIRQMLPLSGMRSGSTLVKISTRYMKRREMPVARTDDLTEPRLLSVVGTT